MRVAAPSFDFPFILSLHDRDVRDRSGLCLVEGERFVISALTTRAVVRAVITVERRRSNPTLDKLLERHLASGGALISASTKEFEQLTRAKEPQGIAAIVDQPWSALPEGRTARSGVWLGFESLEIEANLGAAIRSSAAAGARGVMLISGTIDPFDPRTVRATMGAIFTQRICRTSIAELARWKREARALIVGTSAHAQRDYRRVDYRRPLVLMMGCERGGLSPGQRSLCDLMVKIPMTGRVDSLNVAIAASLMLYAACDPKESC